jgi:hypothetical protein
VCVREEGVCRSNGGNELGYFRGVLNAFGTFDARAHVNGQRFRAGPQMGDAIAHVCRCQPTRQDEVSVDVYLNA